MGRIALYSTGTSPGKLYVATPNRIVKTPYSQLNHRTVHVLAQYQPYGMVLPFAPFFVIKYVKIEVELPQIGRLELTTLQFYRHK